MPHIEDPTDTRNCQDEDEIDLPEADVSAIMAARKNRELHTYFPEFELLDVDDAWAKHMQKSPASSFKTGGSSFKATTPDPGATPTGGATESFSAPWKADEPEHAAAPEAVVVEAPAATD